MMKKIIVVFLSALLTSCSTLNQSNFVTLNTVDNHEVKFDNIVYKQIDYHKIAKIENKNLLIAIGLNKLYKIDSNGNIIDSLIEEHDFITEKNIDFQRNIIAIDDGYYPNWINNGDKTLKPYDEILNENLSLDSSFLKKMNDISDSLRSSRSSHDRNFDKYQEIEKEFFANLENFETLHLINELRSKSHYDFNYGPYVKNHKESQIFFTDDKVIRVYYAIEFLNAARDFRRFHFDNIIIKPKTIKYNSFRKTEYVPGHWNVLSASSGRWKGDSYYKIPLGNSEIKFKVENSDRRNTIIEVFDNFWSENENFILVKNQAELSGYLIKLQK